MDAKSQTKKKDDLFLNKILGAALATGLGLFGLNTLSTMMFADKSAAHGAEKGGDHGEGHAEGEVKTLSAQMCDKFAYCIEIAEVAAAGGDAAEAVFDLGAALAGADLAKGERIFNGQCKTCHTIEAGGANGTGPNLHNVVGAMKAKHAGFNYSAALSGIGTPWTYENLDAWIKNPGAYAKGTSMSFAGLRKDPDRAAVIAYLAKNTEGAPAFPAPLAADAPAPAEGIAAPAEGEVVPADGETAPATPAPAEPAPAEPAPT